MSIFLSLSSYFPFRTQNSRKFSDRAEAQLEAYANGVEWHRGGWNCRIIFIEEGD